MLLPPRGYISPAPRESLSPSCLLLMFFLYVYFLFFIYFLLLLFLSFLWKGWGKFQYTGRLRKLKLSRLVILMLFPPTLPLHRRHMCAVKNVNNTLTDRSTHHGNDGADVSTSIIDPLTRFFPPLWTRRKEEEGKCFTFVFTLGRRLDEAR